MPRTLVAGLLLALTAAAADSPGIVASKVLKAFRAGDGAALKKLAKQWDPDRWLVVDELCGAGEHDAALAYVKTLSRLNAAHEKLPAYIEARRGRKEDPKVRTAVAKANLSTAAQTLELLKGMSAPPDTVLAVALDHLRGVGLAEAKRLEEATNTFLAGARTAQKIGWLKQAGILYMRAGYQAGRRGADAQAIEHYRSALEVHEQQKYSRGIAATKLQLASLHVGAGEPERGIALLNGALGTIRELNDPNLESNALTILATCHWDRFEFAKAREHVLRSIEAAKKSPYAGREINVARLRAKLARITAEMGNLNEAREQYEQALELLRTVDREAHMVLRDLAMTHADLGDRATALRLLDEALSISKKVGHHRAEGSVRIAIGSVYSALGDRERADAETRQALATYEKARYPPGIADATFMLGRIASRRGLLDEALVTLRAAEAAARNVKFSESLVAACLEELAFVHRRRGEIQEASVLLDEALVIRRKIGKPDAIARDVSESGLLSLLRGNSDRALALVDEALREAREFGASTILTNCLRAKTAIHLARGEATEAKEAARAAVGYLIRSVGGLSESRAANSRSLYQDIFAGGVAACVRRNDAEGVAWFFEAGRAGALTESLRWRSALQAAVVPRKLLDAELLARARLGEATLAFRTAAKSTDQAERTRAGVGLMEARKEAAEAVARIQRHAKAAARVVYPTPLSATEIAARLRRDEVLVEYGLFNDSIMGISNAFAVVVADSGARFVDLGPTKAIVAAVAAFRPDVDEFDTKSAEVRLRELLVAPLHIKASARSVLITPDGELGRVPFGLLYATRNVTYVPSGTAHQVLLEERMKRGKGVLAFGDPDYGAKPNPAALVVQRSGAWLRRLPATADEARGVAGEAAVLGSKATERRLREEGARTRWRAVHLACHGLINEEHPMQSALALTPSDDDDGFLTVLDVFRMKLPTDLVVLSACETGRGKVVEGEGIIGLTRAFMFAGAPRVIVSLWKVDDEATKALMVEFYRLWNPKDGSKGLPTATALKKAQEFVRGHEKWKHPYYWAAWQLWGLPS